MTRRTLLYHHLYQTGNAFSTSYKFGVGLQQCCLLTGFYFLRVCLVPSITFLVTIILLQYLELLLRFSFLRGILYQLLYCTKTLYDLKCYEIEKGMG